MLHREEDKKTRSSTRKLGRSQRTVAATPSRFFNSTLPAARTNSKTRPRNSAFALIVGCLRPAFPERESLSLSFSLSVAAILPSPPSPIHSYGIYALPYVIVWRPPQPHTNSLAQTWMSDSRRTSIRPRTQRTRVRDRFSSTVCSLAMYRRRRVYACSLSLSHMHQQVENYHVSNLLRVFVRQTNM